MFAELHGQLQCNPGLARYSNNFCWILDAYKFIVHRYCRGQNVEQQNNMSGWPEMISDTCSSSLNCSGESKLVGHMINTKAKYNILGVFAISYVTLS